jgi:hypothetical protein
VDGRGAGAQGEIVLLWILFECPTDGKTANGLNTDCKMIDWVMNALNHFAGIILLNFFTRD